MFIYAYREAATGRAVYVGCANNVKTRDHGHCAATAGHPIDREIARIGRDAFTLETLEEVTPENYVERENYWMDKLGTFRTAHGFNIHRAIPRDLKPEGCKILIHFTDEHLEALKAERQRTGCSVSEFIRRAVIAALEKKAEGKP